MEEWDPADYPDDDVDDSILRDLDLNLDDEELKFELSPRKMKKVDFSEEDVLNFVEKNDNEDLDQLDTNSEGNPDKLIQDFINRNKNSRKKPSRDSKDSKDTKNSPNEDATSDSNPDPKS